MHKRSILHLLIIPALCGTGLRAQKISKKQADSTLDAQSSFTIYKDNYFITGIPLDRPPSKYTSDVKYQISFRHLLTRNPLPLKTYLFISYTQLAFWDIYRNSKPFSEINFNPAIGLARRFYAGSRFAGMGTLMLEHQSNGRDSIYSRSWNRLSASFQGPVSEKAVLALKVWLPFGYKDENPDLLHYLGYGEASLTYVFLPRKLVFDCTVRKGSQWDWKGAVETQLNYRPFRNGNEYLMLQWFQGYGENLVNYREKISMLRMGVIIKPSYFGMY